MPTFILHFKLKIMNKPIIKTLIWLIIFLWWLFIVYKYFPKYINDKDFIIWYVATAIAIVGITNFYFSIKNKSDLEAFFIFILFLLVFYAIYSWVFDKSLKILNFFRNIWLPIIDIKIIWTIVFTIWTYLFNKELSKKAYIIIIWIIIWIIILIFKF